MELPELQSFAPTIYFLMRTVLEFIFTCTCHKLDYVNCFNKRKTIVLKFSLRIRNGKEEILLQNLTKLVEVEKAGVQEYRRDFCHVILLFFCATAALRTTRGSLSVCMSVCLYVSFSFFAIYSKNLQATHTS